MFNINAATDLLEFPSEIRILLSLRQEGFGEEEVGVVQCRERIKEPALVWHALCSGNDASRAI